MDDILRISNCMIVPKRLPIFWISKFRKALIISCCVYFIIFVGATPSFVVVLIIINKLNFFYCSILKINKRRSLVQENSQYIIPHRKVNSVDFGKLNKNLY